MTHGRNICNQLKAVRRRIAEENNIPLEIEECTYHGECRGTCPRCEAEVRYLESTLADRLRLGKAATVAGIALALAGTAAAQVQAPAASADTGGKDPHELSLVADSVVISGIVRNARTSEDIPFCRLHIVDTKRGIDIDTAVDNGFDGKFAIRVPKGEYEIYISHYGYNEAHVPKQVVDKDTDLGEIRLEPGPVPVIMVGGAEAIPMPGPTHLPGHTEYYQVIGGAVVIIR